MSAALVRVYSAYVHRKDKTRLEIFVQVVSVVWESSWTPWVVVAGAMRHFIVRRIEEDVAVAAEDAELAKDDWRTPFGVSFESDSNGSDPFESDPFKSGTPVVDSWGDPTNPFSDSYWK